MYSLFSGVKLSIHSSFGIIIEVITTPAMVSYAVSRK